MKKIIGALLGVMILVATTLANAYVIDGLLDDWGVLPGVYGASDWEPNPGVHWVEEDQITYYLNPGYGGQPFDVEAIYFDRDLVNAYVAIVTGFSRWGKGGYKPGDIAFDFGIDGSYEYGIKTVRSGVIKGEIYQVSEWENNTLWGPQSDPLRIKNGTKIGSTDLEYQWSYYGSGSGNSHYVIETYVPLSLFGSEWNKPSRIHWTMTCGNDYANLDIPGIPPAPEPGTLLLFAGGICGILAGGALRRFFRQIKRGMDIVVASIGLIITSPLWVLIAIAIKLDSKGPVLLRQERVGEDRRIIPRRKLERGKERRVIFGYGQNFIMYKFRSMYVDAEKYTGAVWAKEDDDRITRVGHILRKTHLDELPQLINVIRGKMSIIGPRPERQIFIDDLHKKIKKYVKRLRVKPGITGLAQVRQHYDASLSDVKRKVHYDLLYIRKMCLLMDLRIIASTLVVMLTGKGAR